MERIAKVESNRDPNSLGRVRVRIYPEFESLDVQSLPWAEPMNSDDICIPGETVGSFRIPEEGSYIVVDVDPTWQNFIYTGATPNRDRTDVYSDIADQLSRMTDITATYPQPVHLIRTKDGCIGFHNTDTGEMGIVNSEGVYLIYDSQGNFSMGKKNGSSLVLTTGGELTFKGTVNASDGSSLVLFEPLKEVLEKLLDHIHIAPNGPTQPAQEASGNPLSTLKINLQSMESK